MAVGTAPIAKLRISGQFQVVSVEGDAGPVGDESAAAMRRVSGSMTGFSVSEVPRCRTRRPRTRF